MFMLMSLNCGHHLAYHSSPRTKRRTRLSVTLSTTNPTWTDSSANLGLSGKKLAVNHLCHGMALLERIDVTTNITSHNLLYSIQDMFNSVVLMTFIQPSYVCNNI
jgi:hypothetical protein